jgi:hypothetical protein
MRIALRGVDLRLPGSGRLIGFDLASSVARIPIDCTPLLSLILAQAHAYNVHKSPYLREILMVPDHCVYVQFGLCRSKSKS